MTSRRWQRFRRAATGLALLSLLVAASAAAQSPKPQRHALLIGIDKYLGGGIQGVRPLEFAVKDAETLKSTLEKRGWNTRVVVRGEATRARIVRELYDLALTARPSDKVLIYFAGHGVLDPLSGGHTYWLTYTATIPTLVADGIRLNHIMEYASEIPALEKIVLLDHCYSGDIKLVRPEVPAPAGATGIEEESRLAPPRPELDTDPTIRALYPPDFETLKRTKEDRMVVLGAARGPAYEHADWGHGMFTKAILDVLADPATDTSNPKDGKISLNEFWTRVSARVDSMANDKGLAQEPFGSDITLNQLDWVLFDAVVDAANEADELRNVLTDLSLAATEPMDYEIKQVCHVLLQEWAERQQRGVAVESKHRHVVEELRGIRDFGGPTADADTKKRSLEDLVRGLGLVQ